MKNDRTRTLPRATLHAVLVAIIATSLVHQPAHAADYPDDFVMLYFPHTGVEIEFTDDWGAGRSGGRRHQGTDIFSEKLTPVVAVADGFVERLGDGARPGFYVKLRHASDWSSWYMHLNNDTAGTDDGRAGRAGAYAEGIEEGTFVAAGDVIGWVGDSGNAEWTTSHTHFELHLAGRPINPYPYLAAVWERQQRVWALSDEID